MNYGGSTPRLNDIGDPDPVFLGESALAGCTNHLCINLLGMTKDTMENHSSWVLQWYSNSRYCSIELRQEACPITCYFHGTLSQATELLVRWTIYLCNQ